MQVGLSADQAQQLGFWRELCPGLTIEGNAAPPRPALGDLERHNALLRREGYINVPGVLAEEFIAPLRVCVERLHTSQIPLAFAFVYDEFWRAFHALAPLLAAVLGKGYRALPDFWVWHVLPSEKANGWGPHRDRIQPTLEPDNSPHTLTVWLPLTDATPLNGCIYVLPAHLDERFKLRRWDGDGNIAVKDPQNIRALPAPSGSMLAWNQAVLHWGGRASSLAGGPRSSIAFEFQRGDKDAFNEPLLDPVELPPFQRRLGLIGKQVLQYEHMYPLPAEIAAIARTLRTRFMPEQPATKAAADPLAGVEWESGGGG